MGLLFIPRVLLTLGLGLMALTTLYAALTPGVPVLRVFIGVCLFTVALMLVEKLERVVA